MILWILNNLIELFWFNQILTHPCLKILDFEGIL